MSPRKRSLPINLADVVLARSLLSSTLPITPVSQALSDFDSAKRAVFFKWDNRTYTGSFKERGAAHFVRRLSSADRLRGVCAASAGNHALALAYHAGKLGVPCFIVMPIFSPLNKVERTRALGASVTLQGDSFDEASEFAQRFAEEKKLVYAPPFDHPHIMAGQGTSALELLEQVPDLDAVIVPVGGGGLISGIATVIKEKNPKVQVIGVQSEWAINSRNTQTKSKLPSTSIADGIAVKKIGSLTQHCINAYVDELVTVGEAQIARAIVVLLERERTVVEGAGAAAMAALLAGKISKNLKRIALITCGSNIDTSMLFRVIEWDMNERNKIARIRISLPDRPGALSFATSIVAQNNGNIMHVLHNRASAFAPGNVDCTFTIEVLSKEHALAISHALQKSSIQSKLLENI